MESTELKALIHENLKKEDSPEVKSETKEAHIKPSELPKYFGLLKWTAPLITLRTDRGGSGDSRGGELSETLNQIIEPREFVRDGKTYTQFASSQPASRSELLRLAEKFEKCLVQEGARENGLCSIRWQIYMELLDELIRQEVIVCSAGGWLLKEVREEAKATVGYYRRLYESAAAYSLKKVLLTDEERYRLEAERHSLQVDVEELKSRSTELALRMEENESVYSEMRTELELKHLRELEYLENINSEVKEQPRTLVPPPRKQEDTRATRM